MCGVIIFYNMSFYAQKKNVKKKIISPVDALKSIFECAFVENIFFKQTLNVTFLMQLIKISILNFV